MVWRDVTVERQARLEHGGRLSRRTLITADGEMHQLGLMLPGLYRHTPPVGERWQIVQGRLRLRRADEGDWRELGSGAAFTFAADTPYELEVSEPVEFVASPVSRG